MQIFSGVFFFCFCFVLFWLWKRNKKNKFSEYLSLNMWTSNKFIASKNNKVIRQWWPLPCGEGSTHCFDLYFWNFKTNHNHYCAEENERKEKKKTHSLRQRLIGMLISVLLFFVCLPRCSFHSHSFHLVCSLGRVSQAHCRPIAIVSALHSFVQCVVGMI